MAELAQVLPFGDAALLVAVEDGELAERAARSAVLAAGLAGRLSTGDGWCSPTPGIGGVLVPFDPERLGPDGAAQRVQRALEALAEAGDEPATAPGRTIEIPVRYGGEGGPDLPDVAAATGLDPAEVVRLHAAGDYRVLVLGFLPGFAYLGPLDQLLAAVRRRPMPRAHVRAGSVAIAAGMTAVYPTESPGGWQVIGRTEETLWDPAADPPNLLAPTDRVRFVALDIEG